jgi:hypothetical protein
MLMQIRRLHAYIGTFIAPSVIYFAATGLLQIYNLHEAHPGYTPPRIIEMLSGVHKDQRFGPGHRDPDDAEKSHPDGPAAAASRPAPAPQGEKAHHTHLATALLKLFFASVAIGLIFSTSFGIWMALQQGARRRMHLVLLLTGALVPTILAALTV